MGGSLLQRCKAHAHALPTRWRLHRNQHWLILARWRTINNCWKRGQKNKSHNNKDKKPQTFTQSRTTKLNGGLNLWLKIDHYGRTTRQEDIETYSLGWMERFRNPEEITAKGLRWTLGHLLFLHQQVINDMDPLFFRSRKDRDIHFCTGNKKTPGRGKERTFYF